MEDRVEAVVDGAEVDAEYSSPGLAVEATIMSTASSNSSTPFTAKTADGKFWSQGAI